MLVGLLTLNDLITRPLSLWYIADAFFPFKLFKDVNLANQNRLQIFAMVSDTAQSDFCELFCMPESFLREQWPHDKVQRDTKKQILKERLRVPLYAKSLSIIFFGSSLYKAEFISVYSVGWSVSRDETCYGLNIQLVALHALCTTWITSSLWLLPIFCASQDIDVKAVARSASMAQSKTTQNELCNCWPSLQRVIQKTQLMLLYR